MRHQPFGVNQPWSHQQHPWKILEAVVCTAISPLRTKEFVVEDSVPVESCEPLKPVESGEPSKQVELQVSDPPRKRLRLMDFAVAATSPGAAAPNQTLTRESSKKANDSHEGDRPAASVVDESEPMDDSVSQAPVGPTTTSASRSDGGYWKPIGWYWAYQTFCSTPSF